jgi:glycosyltransferase involved in cell wall biosynthesis
MTVGMFRPRKHRRWLWFLPSIALLQLDILRFVRVVRRERPAIIHGFLLHAYVFGAIAGGLTGVPVIVASRRSLSRFKTPFMRLSERVGNWFTDYIVANSEAVRQDAIRTERLSPERIGVIHNGLDLAVYDGIPAGTIRALRDELGLGAGPVAIVVANLHWYKGHEYFLQAWADVCRAHPDAVALLVGDGPVRAAREADARELGIEANVRFLGTRRDVPALLAVADVLVHPSREEGFCNAVIEAMAAARPVVATAVGGNPEAVVDGETGLLVPPLDAGRLAEAVLTVLGLPDRGKAWGVAGRRRAVEQFQRSWMVQRYEALYDQLLAKAGYAHVRHQRTA